jgi:hypothetical protein
MKKILYFIVLTTTLMLAACSDNEYSDKYPNPAETDKATCDKLMTGVFYKGRDYTFNAYWRLWTWDNYSLGVYAQTIGYLKSDGAIYAVSDGYANDRWVNFYNTLTQYRVLENVYKDLDEDQKNTYRIFKDLAEVFIYDHLSQVIDVWGDVPFNAAGYLAITGDVTSSYPSYDKATDLYTMMLDRLGELAADIAAISGNLPTLAGTQLPVQDFINNGNLDKWERYANSLRLRLAVRVAQQGALADKGKAVIAEILNGNKKLVENNDQTIALASNNDDTANFFNPDDLRTGYNENSTYSRASVYMLNVLNASSEDLQDPRLPFLYSKNAQGQYKGLDPENETYAEQEANASKPSSERVYSRIDSATVGYNREFISPILTAAEVAFLRAEVYQAGLGVAAEPVKAEAAFKDGVWYSSEFIFNENKISPSTEGYKPSGGVYPTEDAVRTYAGKLWENGDKHKTIIAQKWLSFGYFQSSQAWNEMRRVGYDYLGFFYPADNGAQEATLRTVPNRVRYPLSERNNNTANYNAQKQAMGGNDNYDAPKPFWAK